MVTTPEIEDSCGAKLERAHTQEALIPGPVLDYQEQYRGNLASDANSFVATIKEFPTSQG
jgi:hypothetical protein